MTITFGTKVNGISDFGFHGSNDGNKLSISIANIKILALNLNSVYKNTARIKYVLHKHFKI